MLFLLLSLPLTFIAVSAPRLVPLVFGPQWEESYPAAQILAIAGVLSVGAWLDHGLFYGLGRPGSWFWYALAIDALTLATTIGVVRWGIVAIAFGFLGVAAIATVVRLFLVSVAIGCRVRELLRPFGYLILVGAGAGGAGSIVMQSTNSLPAWIALLLAGLAILLVHGVISFVAARASLVEIARLVARSRWGTQMPFFAKIGALG